MNLRDAWERHAREFAAWARKPGHDSYPRFHRDQFLQILPAPGRLTVDVGCGEGRLSRDLKSLGHSVLAVDASPTMVALARAAEPSIPVVRADAARLPLAEAVADLVICFMSLQDIDDMPAAIHQASRVLVEQGRLCIAIVHPLNSAGHFTSEEPDSPFVIADSYLGSRRTVDTVERDGVAMTFHSEHRPLAAYFAALESAGFVVESLREHAVPDGSFTRPAGKRWQRVPLFLHLRAVKSPHSWPPGRE
jgi:SAM-dependent methyltransferase